MLERHVRRDGEIEWLWQALGIEPGACLAFIGAGGKTSSILALAELAAARGLSTVVTTTTKIRPPTNMPLVLRTDEIDVVETVRARLRSSPVVVVGETLTGDGKVAGLDASNVCRLVEYAVTDILLCEADGAAGRPLKVHGEHEPSIPPCVTSVAVLGGVDALGRVPGPDVIHRFDRYLDWARVPHSTITPQVFAELLLLAAGKVDPRAPAVFVLNKADDETSRGAATRVASALRTREIEPTIVITSHPSSTDARPASAAWDDHERAGYETP